MSCFTQKPYFLSIGCLFKNEEDSVVEWIEHYIDNGVEHFFSSTTTVTIDRWNYCNRTLTEAW